MKNEFSSLPEMKNETEVFRNYHSDNFLSGFSWQRERTGTLDLNIIQENTLRGASSPTVLSFQTLAALIDEVEPGKTDTKIKEYIVKQGDNLWSIARKFNITEDTIRWANNINGSKIQIDQKLVILSVSGVIHYVKSGDTISEIVKTYKGEVKEIVAFNSLANENDIYIGDILIIPDGVMPLSIQPKSALVSLPLADSQFIVPVSSPYIITQGLHWYNAIDFSHPGNACGRPVFAVAGGTIQKTGSAWISGNYVRILHLNGVVTFYGHLSVIAVKTGEAVNVGDIIGYIGNTGYTIGPTGCHLHFEVRGARNPFLQ